MYNLLAHLLNYAKFKDLFNRSKFLMDLLDLINKASFPKSKYQIFPFLFKKAKYIYYICTKTKKKLDYFLDLLLYLQALIIILELKIHLYHHTIVNSN